MIDFGTIGTALGTGIGLLGAGLTSKTQAPSTVPGQKTDWWAMNETSDAAQRAMSAIMNALNTSTNYEMPFYRSGTQALNTLNTLVNPQGGLSTTDMISGLPPGAGANALNWLTQTPMYQFPLQEGIKALDRSASSRGMLLSGAQQKGISDYAQNYAVSNALAPAQNQYQQYLNRITGITGMGQQQANALANLTMGAGQNIAGINMQQAGLQNALANNIASMQNQGSLYSSLGQMQNQNALGSLFGGIGGLVSQLPWGQMGNAMGFGSSYGGGGGGSVPFNQAGMNALNTFNTIWG